MPNWKMEKCINKGLLAALNKLYWKQGYFGGKGSFEYIKGELSDFLSEGEMFAFDEEKEIFVIKKIAHNT